MVRIEIEFGDGDVFIKVLLQILMVMMAVFLERISTNALASLAPI